MQEILKNLYVQFKHVKGSKVGNYLFSVISQHEAKDKTFIYRVSTVNLVPCNYSLHLSSVISQMSEERKAKLFEKATKISQNKIQIQQNPLNSEQMKHIYISIRTMFTNLESLPFVKGKPRQYYTNGLVGNFFVASDKILFQEDFKQFLQQTDIVQIVKDYNVISNPFN